MIIGPMEPLVQQERYRDMLREVEMDRLARLATGDAPHRPSLRGRALARLGAWLHAWGEVLQQRYAE